MESITQFVHDWTKRGYEKGEMQIFWLQFLRDAHKENDNAVLAAYSFSADCTESDIVAELMNLYRIKFEYP